MSRFLVDENLPVKVPVWDSVDIEFVTSSFASEKDAAIWEYAKQNDLTIVTKDSDFSFRILTSSPPPRVIHIKVGNMRLRELSSFLDSRWPAIVELSKANKLVIVFVDRIEAVN